MLRAEPECAEKPEEYAEHQESDAGKTCVDKLALGRLYHLPLVFDRFEIIGIDVVYRQIVAHLAVDPLLELACFLRIHAYGELIDPVRMTSAVLIHRPPEYGRLVSRFVVIALLRNYHHDLTCR